MNPCLIATVLCSLQGHPHVVDGDTLRFGKQSVRLHGIDAEERNEPHGPRATEGLRRIISATREVKCQPTGDTTYNRVVARCYTAEGFDVAQLLVYQGLVLDCARYSGGRYRQYEPPEARRILIQKPYCRTRT